MKQFLLTLLLFGFLCLNGIGVPFAESNSFSRIEWPKTDFNKRSIKLEEILSGGPPKDGIPAIDTPSFISVVSAQNWLSDFEPVISVEINGKAKAYPLQILMFHEIVNDDLNGKAISVTFCPLCNTSIVFSRWVNGQKLDFGTTGRLRNSDLIMYDRQTESWWQQFTGEALIGSYTGTQLEELTSQIVSFNTFYTQYPDGQVLSRKTGFSRQYGKNPYRGYDDINNTPFLMRGQIDDRLPPMERVLSVTTEKNAKIYPFSVLTESNVFPDVLGNISLVIFNTGQIYSALDASTIRQSKTVPAYTVFSTEIEAQTLHFYWQNNSIYDRETSSKWNVMGKAVDGKLKGKQLKPMKQGVHFAFAWLAFNPDVEIYRQSN